MNHENIFQNSTLKLKSNESELIKKRLLISSEYNFERTRNNLKTQKFKPKKSIENSAISNFISDSFEKKYSFGRQK